jgi:hypothetical protein
MSTLKEIEQRQQRMYKLIDEMNAQEDMTAMLEVVKKLEVEAQGLETALTDFEAKMEKQTPKIQRGAFEVVLTPEQRQRILKETGVDMRTVWIKDQGGARNAAMPATLPPVIEAEALKQAREQKALEPARQAAKRQVDQALDEISNQSPMHAEAVAKVKADPRFQKAIDVNKKF